MKEKEAKNVHGGVIHISKPEYTHHVTNSSKTGFVILLLYQDYLPECKVIQVHFETLANLHRNVKFVKIIACNPIQLK